MSVISMMRFGKYRLREAARYHRSVSPAEHKISQLSLRIIFVVAALFILSGCGKTVSPSEALSTYTREHAEQVRGSFYMAPQPVLMLPEPDLTITPEVQARLRHWMKLERGTIDVSLRRKKELGPLLTTILRDEGVPSSMIAVVLIESTFNPHAKSPSGAKGLWQFMKSTARVYGLQVGVFEDQRIDPVLSTIAAARHLRDLYRAFRDWNLALAAYNAGSAAVDRAISKGKSTDFWTLARRGLFRRETSQYVPKFIAAARILNNPREYGFTEP